MKTIHPSVQLIPISDLPKIPYNPEPVPNGSPNDFCDHGLYHAVLGEAGGFCDTEHLHVHALQDKYLDFNPGDYLLHTSQHAALIPYDVAGEISALAPIDRFDGWAVCRKEMNGSISVVDIHSYYEDAARMARGVQSWYVLPIACDVYTIPGWDDDDN